VEVHPGGEPGGIRCEVVVENFSGALHTTVQGESSPGLSEAQVSH